MDADTRHQLKQNEFAEALSKLVDFSDKRTTAWIVVILVVALGYAGYKFWGWHQRTHMIQSAQALTLIDASDASMGDAPLAELRQLIADNSEPGLVSLARLQLAEGLEARGKGPDGAAKLAEAETQYKTILGIPNAPHSVKAAALYRLGIFHETKRDFEQAREMYTTLGRNLSYQGSPFTGLAETRLEQLDELAVPVVFKPGIKPLPTTQPAAQPALKPIIREVPRKLPLPISRKPAAEEAPTPVKPTKPEPANEEPPAEEPSTEPEQPEQP